VPPVGPQGGVDSHDINQLISSLQASYAEASADVKQLIDWRAGGTPRRTARL
jgi:hypothetical protein